MSYKVKPTKDVIKFFERLGFEYKVNTDSIYTDKRDVPIHYFQTKGANGFNLVSTILADEATKIYRNSVINAIEPLALSVLNKGENPAYHDRMMYEISRMAPIFYSEVHRLVGSYVGSTAGRKRK